MTRDELQALLDRHGGDPAHWPPAERAHAERLMAADADARADVAAAREFDAALARFAQASTSDDELATRILGRLNGPLPQQRRALWRWPAALLDWEFAPAWPRVAALAGCAVIGFAIGIAGIDRPIDDRGDPIVASRDIGALVFEPDSLTVRP